MNFSIKKTLPLWILIFTCLFLGGAEATEEDSYLSLLTDCRFLDQEDGIKVKMVFAEGTIGKCTTYKIKKPNPESMSVQIQNDQPEYLEYLGAFYQIVDVEVHATPSYEEEGITFQVIEHLEIHTPDKKIANQKHTNSTKYFIKTDKKLNYKTMPHLTVGKNSPEIKYIKFFTNR